tara:strand:- start:701 stop:895 length:195 start_codon:yes stop_codon:yes gene_type:complete
MIIHSEILANAFWMDHNNDLCSAPLQVDGTVDDDNMIYVEEWQCMNELSEAQHKELDKIIKIFS